MHRRWVEEIPIWDAHFAATESRLTEIEQMPAGPARMAALETLRSGPVNSAAAIRMAVLDAGDLAWLESKRMVDTYDAVHGYGHLPGLSDTERVLNSVGELACALRISGPEASRLLALHLYTAQHLTRAWVALNKGEFSDAHVTAIWRATEHCEAWVIKAVDDQLVPLAVGRRWTPEQIRKQARKIIIRIDPDGARDRAKKAKKEDTDVTFHPAEDEMATVCAHGDSAVARQMMDTLQARAAQIGKDPTNERSVGERRFHAMAEFILGPDYAGGHGSPFAPGSARAHGDDITNPPSDDLIDDPTPAQARARRRGEVLVRIDLTTLLGLDDNPGELDGYGSITAQLARELAKDAEWRRFITDPMSGKLLDLGRSTYTPSAFLRRFIAARDETCQAVGCERPARGCQADHKTDWERLGCTDCNNLQPLCDSHHPGKTKKFWKLNQLADGDT